jgi:hypothetical protein
VLRVSGEEERDALICAFVAYGLKHLFVTDKHLAHLSQDSELELAVVTPQVNKHSSGNSAYVRNL